MSGGDTDRSAARALARLQAAGLLTGFAEASFAAECRREKPPVVDVFDPELDDPDDWVEPPEPELRVDMEVALVAAAALYGARGPTEASLRDRAFALERPAEGASEVIAAVRGALEQWLGRPIAAESVAPGASLERLLGYVGDAMFLADHRTWSGPGLYSIAGWRESDGVAFAIHLVRDRPEALAGLGLQVSRHVSPDTEAAAAGIFRVGEPPRAFVEHASGCARCREQLASSARAGQLPAGYLRLL
ncbi:MAG: hypothetical protein JNK56_34855 [Myxococcales bacterium]|nr:hypothetical protein [Myxococcales bacterium]